ncbi:Hypothetical predicted protein [Octopus vulgaris]|uniref:Uncharacterized protein n=1 Tax=Octopus vulgaris TaxID=6645 RepID=A0AA36BRT1_OCTVU|nr:Hypothetical predicted protein [Octopus vulgaris]
MRFPLLCWIRMANSKKPIDRIDSILHLHRPMTKLCLSSIFTIYLAEFFSSNSLLCRTVTNQKMVITNL